MLDLRTSPLTPANAVVERRGSLLGALDLPQMLDRVAEWSFSPTAHAARPDSARRSEGFAIQVDSKGYATAAVADQPSAARLANLLTSATAINGDSDFPRVQSLEDAPAIVDRAVLECFYGPLWRPDARKAVLERAAGHGATTYVYGPSADRRTGALWREPYTGEEADGLAHLVETATRHGMETVWRVSPGAPLERNAAMRLTDPDEVAVLLRRVREVAAFGINRVLIAFDDIDAVTDATTLADLAHDPHPLAAAHARVVNAVADELEAHGVSVIACPTHYWGTRPSMYRHRFGELLRSDIPICWTGSGVISASIRAEDARQVSEDFQHPLWLWDNYPVNDWDGVTGSFSNEMQPRRLPLSPIHGRDPALSKVVVGYGSNAALDPHSGLPAVCTALDWAWAAGSYKPERSFAHALLETGLPTDPLALVADAAGPVPGGRRIPGRLAQACASLLSTSAATSGSESFVLARDAMRQHLAAASELAGIEDPLVRELAPWLEELKRGCSAGLLALDILAAYPENQEYVDARAPELRAAALLGTGRSVAVGMLDALIDYGRGLAGGGTPASPDPGTPA